MRTLPRAVLVVSAIGLTIAPWSVGSQALSLRVMPSVAAAPGFIRISAVIESSSDNRGLEIIADSSDYYRSSWIQLEGARAPRQTVVDFPNLPPGLYEIRAVLGGTAGTRAIDQRMVRVVPSPGSGR